VQDWFSQGDTNAEGIGEILLEPDQASLSERPRRVFDISEPELPRPVGVEAKSRGQE
jgi:hypothetical protein